MVHEEVERFCLDRLCDSYNKTTTLFDRQLRQGAWGLTQGTEEHHQHGDRADRPEPCLDRSRSARDRLGADSQVRSRGPRVRRHHGALGLIFWANRVTDGPSSAAVLARFGGSLDDVARWTRPLETMEVGWLLAGLGTSWRFAERPLEACVPATRAALLARFVRRTRTFVHATPEARPFHRVRRWVANFADQIYSIQARSLAWRAGARRVLDGGCRTGGGAVDRATRQHGPMVVALHSRRATEASPSHTPSTRSTSTVWRRWRCARSHVLVAQPTTRQSPTVVAGSVRTSLIHL